MRGSDFLEVGRSNPDLKIVWMRGDNSPTPLKLTRLVEVWTKVVGTLPDAETVVEVHWGEAWDENHSQSLSPP